MDAIKILKTIANCINAIRKTGHIQFGDYPGEMERLNKCLDVLTSLIAQQTKKDNPDFYFVGFTQDCGYINKKYPK